MKGLSARYVETLEYLKSGGRISICTSVGYCFGRLRYSTESNFRIEKNTLWLLHQQGFINTVEDLTETAAWPKWTHISISKRGEEILESGRLNDSQ